MALLTFLKYVASAHIGKHCTEDPEVAHQRAMCAFRATEYPSLLFCTGANHTPKETFQSIGEFHSQLDNTECVYVTYKPIKQP